MKYKLQQSIFAGLTATIVMSLFMMITSFMGLPEMSPPALVAGMIGVSIIAGWIIHFLIGILFAMGYVFLFNNLLKKLLGKILKGVVYGIIAFIVAQISFPVLGAIFGEANMPEPEGSMVLLMMSSIAGHIVFGIVIALMVKPAVKKIG